MNLDRGRGPLYWALTVLLWMCVGVVGMLVLFMQFEMLFTTSMGAPELGPDLGTVPNP